MFPEAKELRNLEDRAGYFDEQRAKNFEIIAAGVHLPLHHQCDNGRSLLNAAIFQGLPAASLQQHLVSWVS